jgi:hypothetical protein
LLRAAPQELNEDIMKKMRNQSVAEGMRDEYDFKGGIRGKYARRYAQGSNVVVLEPDVAKVFSDSEKVNRSLRAVAGLTDPHRKGSSGRSPALVREKPAKKYGK